MRRVVAVAIAVLALTSCADTRRPEGIVERWLQSLDQGRAGTPERYAPDDVSERLLPGFRTLDPGQFDVIEVGRGAVRKMGPSFAGQMDLAIPFRVVTTDGAKVRGAAWLTEDGTRIALIRVNDPEAPLPSEGGPPIAEMSPSMWLAGLGLATVLALMGSTLMLLVRRTAKVASRTS